MNSEHQMSAWDRSWERRKIHFLGSLCFGMSGASFVAIIELIHVPGISVGGLKWLLIACPVAAASGIAAFIVTGKLEHLPKNDPFWARDHSLIGFLGIIPVILIIFGLHDILKSINPAFGYTFDGAVIGGLVLVSVVVIRFWILMPTGDSKN